MNRCVLMGSMLALIMCSLACAGGKDNGSEPNAIGGGAGVQGGSFSGTAGGVASVGGASGSLASASAGSSGGEAGGGAAAGGGGTGAEGADAGSDGAIPDIGSGTGSLPAVSDLEMPGPFTSKQGAGPAGFVVVYPQELGKDGIKHPIVSWGPGAAENAGSFTTLLGHLASHGFVIISYDGTPQGQELATAIDWIVAESARTDSVFYQKLDTSKISAAGHSAGSLATFRIGADARLTTTIHLSGGTFDPHTDIANLHAPTMFICGDAGGDGLVVGDVARPNCDIDFNNAKVPVFYGTPKGASHMSATEIGDATLRSIIGGAFVGWLRWQLAGDVSRKSMFVGNACTLCSDAAWVVQQKALL